jgi:hypothetical protein
MKAVIIVAMIASAFGFGLADVQVQSANPIHSLEDSEVLDVIEGLLTGLAFGFHVGDIEECIVNATDTSYYMYEAIVHFEKKDLIDIALGLKDLASAIDGVSDAILTCASAYADDAAELEKELAVFKSPLTLVFEVGKNLVVNGD